MKKYIKIKLIGLALVGVIIAGCGKTASVDPEPIVAPDGYPVATFTTDFTGTEITEGDTIIYSVVFDKTIDRAVTFQVTQTDGDAEAEVDYIATPGVLVPYSLETEVSIVIVDDGDPEAGETLSFEVGAVTVADKYLVDESVINPTLAVNVTNLNDPTLMTIKLEWDNGNDYDLVTGEGFTDGDTIAWWGTGGATGANPEFDYSIWLADPVNTYNVYLLEWGAGEKFNYTLTFGHPDGTNQIVEGSFDPATAMDDFTADYWDHWGGLRGFRIAEIEVDGSDAFTVTPL